MGRSATRRILRVFLTLRGRLILLVCFATVPAISFIFFAAAKERESALERMETEARHLGSLASREHAHQINGGRGLLRRLGGTFACEDHAPTTAAACPAWLPALLGGFPQFANIGVADPRGHVVCSAAPIQPSATLSTSPVFTRALASDDVESGDYVVGLVGRPVLQLAHAIRAADRAPCAVAFVAIELGWLDQLARQANLPPDYSLLITDRSGHVLARSGTAASDLALEQGRSHPALANALGRPRGAVVELDGSTRYFVATPMEGVPGVFVVAGLPYERVQGAADRAFYRTLLALVLVTAFALAAAVLAAELSVLRDLRGLNRAVRRFGGGDLTARPPLPGSHGELRELAISFSHMADALTERHREAREAQERLRALSHHLQTVRDEEAARIARELHDELGQVLTGLKMELSGVRRACPADSAAGREAIGQMTEQIDRAIDTVRRISSELRPPVLDRLGLAAAIDWLARECEAKGGPTVVADIGGFRDAGTGRVSTALFRIVQEALTNVVRHAQATHVAVDLAADDATVTLTIRDDGKGIATNAGGPQLGILGMRERVRLLGGAFQIRGEAGQGTTIVVEIPRSPPKEANA